MTTIIINTNIKRNCVIASTQLKKLSDHCIDCWIRMQALVTIFMFEYVIVRVVIFVLTVGRLCLHGMEYQWVNGRCDINDFGTLPLFFSTSKYFRWKFQPWPSFFWHANIPDTWKRGQLSLEQMKKMEKVKVKSHLRYLAACSIQKKRWDIWRIFFSDFRSVFSP